MATTSTITAVLTTATTHVADHASQPGDSQPSTSLLTLSSLFKLLILLSVPLFHSLATHRRKKIIQTKDEAADLATSWQEPWLTNDWTTLYGLIGLAQKGEIGSEHTPFHAEHLSTLQHRLVNEYGTNRKYRWALHRLLERGVIPLRVQDGGVTTKCTRRWGVSSTFPYVILPRWQQSKKRGFFEFLVPHPEREEVTRLIGLLEGNQMNYNISCRMHNPKTKKTRTSTSEPPVLHRAHHKPSEPLHSFPLSVGAESSCEVLLPFLSDTDTEAERARGERIAGLGDYVREGEGTEGRPRVPLLHWSSWAVVRVEAAHWGYIELDHYVLGAVQDCGMGVTYKREICGKKAVVVEVAAWERKVCEKKAKGEIERCGLGL